MSPYLSQEYGKNQRFGKNILTTFTFHNRVQILKALGTSKKYTDEEIIKQIRSGGADKERSLSYLFEQYQGLIKRGMGRFRLTLEEAQEVYMDILIGICRQIENGKFRGESKISSYLYRMYNNRSKNKLRDRKSDKYNWVDEFPQLPDKAKSMLQQMELKDELAQLKHYLQQLGGKCQELLWMKDYYGYSYQEIAAKLEYKSVRVATSARHRCLEKLKALINNRKHEV